jgi:DNA-directed RNA polymerase subunit RPC12/RpoP
MTDTPKDAQLQTSCPKCARPVTWQGTLDLDREIECARCGARGTVRAFVLESSRRRTVTPESFED